MSAFQSMRSAVIAVMALSASAAQAATTSGQAALALAGTWSLSLDTTGASCRVLLRPQQSDKGDYFLGMPAACRHAMPGLETIGRWAAPDAGHLTLDDPTGKAVLSFVPAAKGFAVKAPEGTYAMIPVGETGRSVGSFATIDTAPVPGLATVQPIVSKHRVEPEATETRSDLAGRYAVMRDKRDTGCMVTLDDKSRVKGGERAQLAPGCRDQGIVIFDPSAWEIVKGQLVLTARAGHKVMLEKQTEGLWMKEAKDGGKALGLKKL